MNKTQSEDRFLGLGPEGLGHEIFRAAATTTRGRDSGSAPYVIERVRQVMYAP